MNNKPDSKVEVKACPIKVVYERFKHMDKLLCDPLIRKQYNGENDPYHLTLFDLWDAIKEHQSRPIANNGVSLHEITELVSALEDMINYYKPHNWVSTETGYEVLNKAQKVLSKLPTTAPRGGQ